jgi:hypothetical protein
MLHNDIGSLPSAPSLALNVICLIFPASSLGSRSKNSARATGEVDHVTSPFCMNRPWCSFTPALRRAHKDDYRGEADLPRAGREGRQGHERELDGMVWASG